MQPWDGIKNTQVFGAVCPIPEQTRVSGDELTIYGDESDQPPREGPLATGGVDLWKYKLPLSPRDAAEISTGLQPIPKLLDQAKTNLTGNRRRISGRTE